jgi:NAD(P)-dependent dehydrogenase (short-subunit alcohol dehydrogenase family)
VAFVTGANSGFGFQIAKLLGERGYRVYATYREKARSRELFALARKTKDLQPLRMEVTQKASVDKALRTLARREGRLDVLVNNAGSVTAGFLEDLSQEELKGQFNVNVFGPLRVLRAAAPLMRRTEGGRVLNLGSISGRVVFPGIGAYAASKFALRSLTEGMRMELRPFGIEVGEIAPGSFATRVVANSRMASKMRSGKSPYSPFRSQVEGLVEREFKKAAPASEVADRVGSILRRTRWRMKPAVLVGADAKVLAFLKWLLPDAWFEGFLARFFPWSRFPYKGP